MQNDQKDLSIIISRFPERKYLIIELYRESESFRELCEDFYECRKMLKSSLELYNKNKAICKEYEILLGEIENEISERISG